MASINPFYAEWQACLRAHYQHVIREQDMVTEPTLHHVLLETGVSEEEIQRIRHHILGEITVEAPNKQIPAVLESVVNELPVSMIAIPEATPPPIVPETIPDAPVDPISESLPKPTRQKPPAQLSLF